MLAEGPKNEEALSALAERRKQAASKTIFTRHRQYLHSLESEKRKAKMDAEQQAQTDVEKAQRVRDNCEKQRQYLRSRPTSTAGSPKAPRKAHSTKKKDVPWWALTEADAKEKETKDTEAELLEFAANLDLDEYTGDGALMAALETIRDVVAREDEVEEEEDLVEEAVEPVEAGPGDTRDEGTPAPAHVGHEGRPDTQPDTQPAPAPAITRRKKSVSVFDAHQPLDLVRAMAKTHSRRAMARIMEASGAIIDKSMKTGRHETVTGGPIIVRHDPSDDLHYTTLNVENEVQKARIERKQKELAEHPANLPYLYRNAAI